MFFWNFRWNPLSIFYRSLRNSSPHFLLIPYSPLIYLSCMMYNSTAMLFSLLHSILLSPHFSSNHLALIFSNTFSVSLHIISDLIISSNYCFRCKSYKCTWFFWPICFVRYFIFGYESFKLLVSASDITYFL